MKKRFIFGILLSVFSPSVIHADEPCTEYNAKTVNPAHGGTVSAVKTGAGEFEWTITATPEEGYTFAGWNDAVLTPTRTVTLDPTEHDITYTATFERIPCHTVSAVAYTGGTASASLTDECTCLYTLTATPNAGWSFVGWDEDGDGIEDGNTDNPREVIATDEDITYYAVFEDGRCSHSASAVAYTGGTASAEMVGEGPCHYRLTATHASVYVFVGWDEDGDGAVDGNTDNPRDVYPRKTDIIYYAVFANRSCTACDPTYDNPEVGGSVSAAYSTGECNYTLTATPTDGYAFLKWMDGNIDNPRVVAIDTEKADTSFTAKFIQADVVIDGWTADNKVVVRTKKVDLGSSTAAIFTNGVERAADLALTDVDAGYWSIPASLNAYAGEQLQIVFYCGGEPVSAIDTVVPYVVTADANISTLPIPSNADVQVVRGTLTMDEASFTIAALDIYADAKAVVPAGKELSVRALYMRGNGMTKKYPQLVANGSIVSKTSHLYYDYALDYANFYPLAVPYQVECSDIQTHTGKQASFEIQWYNGEERANKGAGWTVFDDQAPGARLNAGQGYVVFAVPYKWNGIRQTRVSVRFPMTADLVSGETQKTMPVSLYGEDGTQISERNWNYLGNPYLANYSTSEDAHMMVGSYSPNISTPDLSDYTYIESDVRYITTTIDGFQCYIQSRADEGVTIKPFNTFFIQSASAGDLTYTLSQRAQNVHQRRVAGNPQETAFGIVLRNEDASDRTGLLYGEQFTDEYEMNADLVKMSGSMPVFEVYTLAGSEKRAFNALAEKDMMRPVPVGFCNATAGKMTFAFDSKHYDASALQAVILTDSENGKVVNLLEGEYNFTTDRAQNDSRFTIHAILAPQTPTDTEMTASDNRTDGVYDLLGRRVNEDVLLQGVYIVIENGVSRKEVIR